jgi:hypothetical protein
LVTFACKLLYFGVSPFVNALCLAFINALILGVIHGLSVQCARTVLTGMAIIHTILEIGILI